MSWGKEEPPTRYNGAKEHSFSGPGKSGVRGWSDAQLPLSPTLHLQVKDLLSQEPHLVLFSLCTEFLFCLVCCNLQSGAR